MEVSRNGWDMGREGRGYQVSSIKYHVSCIITRIKNQELSFYNFVQGHLDSQKQRPTGRQFEDSVPPFCEVIVVVVVVVSGLTASIPRIRGSLLASNVLPIKLVPSNN